MIAADRAVDLAFQRLSGDSTLSALVGARIGREPIIPVATGLARYPFVTVGVQSDTPLGTLNGTRVWEDTIVRVSAWALAGQGEALLRQIKDRADTLLQGYGGVTGGVQVVKFRLISVDTLPENDEEGQKLHAVLLYRTEARET